MNNLEKAKQLINDAEYFTAKKSFKGLKQDALQAVEIASQINWKYPEKNEFPTEKQRVLGVFKETNLVQEDIFFTENIQYFKNLYIAWCEMPVFNKA